MVRVCERWYGESECEAAAFYSSAWLVGGTIPSEFKPAGLKSTSLNNLELRYGVRSENTSDCKGALLDEDRHSMSLPALMRHLGANLGLPKGTALLLLRRSKK